MKSFFIALLLISTFFANAQTLPISVIYCKDINADSTFNEEILFFNDSLGQYIGKSVKDSTLGTGNPVSIYYFTRYDKNFNVVYRKRITNKYNDEHYTVIKQIDNGRYIATGNVGPADSIGDFSHNYPSGFSKWIGIVDVNGNVLHHYVLGYGNGSNITGCEMSSTGAIYLLGYTLAGEGDFADNYWGNCFLDQPFIAKFDSLMHKQWLHIFNTANDASPYTDLIINKKDELIFSITVAYNAGLDTGIYRDGYINRNKYGGYSSLVKLDTNLNIKYVKTVLSSISSSSVFLDLGTNDELIACYGFSNNDTARAPAYNNHTFKYLYCSFVIYDDTGGYRILKNLGADSILPNTNHSPPDPDAPFNIYKFTKPNSKGWRVLNAEISGGGGDYNGLLSAPKFSGSSGFMYFLLDSNFNVLNHVREELGTSGYWPKLFNDGTKERFLVNTSRYKGAPGCGSTIPKYGAFGLQEIIPWPLGTKEISKPKSKGFTITPNPNNGTFTIQMLQNDFEKTYYIIYSSDGKLILQSNINKQNTEINIQNMPTGKYVVHVRTQKESYTNQFIKE
jgi:Secretion system C-terminal sorting domain